MRTKSVSSIFLSATIYSCLVGAVTAKSVTFTYLSPSNGQFFEQRVEAHSKLHNTFTQSNQLISSNSKNVKTEQLRQVKVIESDPARAAQVQVTYVRATEKNVSKFFARPKQQPVADKTYLVTRIGEQLEVKYPDGSSPPPGELVIVDANMQSVGKTNPIAQFLNGRTVRMGEQLELPSALAAELLSRSLANQAESVSLRLNSLESIDGQAVAVFDTRITGKMNEHSLPSFDCVGDIAVAVATCRTLRIDMRANVSFTEERGPSMATFQVTNEGEVAIKMTAHYDRESSTASRRDM